MGNNNENISKIMQSNNDSFKEKPNLEPKSDFNAEVIIIVLTFSVIVTVYLGWKFYQSNLPEFYINSVVSKFIKK